MAAPDDRSSAEVARLLKLLEGERAGRIRAERSLAELVKGCAEAPTAPLPVGAYVVVPIGFVRSPFPERRGIPRQALLAPHVRSVLELEPSVAGDALEGLQQFSHVWLTWLFHENTLSTRAASARQPTVWSRLGRSWTAKVAPPGLYGGRTGVLATRSPHRPNALGLSLVPVRGVDVRRRLLLLGACDLVDGTPVVDVKPAGSYDCAACLGRLVQAGGQGGGGALPPALGSCAVGGAAAAADGGGEAALHACRAPEWVTAPLQEPRARVEFAAAALASLREACAAGKCRFYGPGAARRRGASAGDARPRAGERERLEHESPSAPGPLPGDGSGRPPAAAAAMGYSEDLLAAEADALAAAVAEVVALDIRAVHQGRGRAPTDALPALVGAALDACGAAAGAPAPEVRDGSKGGGRGADSSYELRFDALRVVFTVHAAEPVAASGSGSPPHDDRPWFCINSVELAPAKAAAVLPVAFALSGGAAGQAVVCSTGVGSAPGPPSRAGGPEEQPASRSPSDDDASLTRSGGDQLE